ncbi:MAG: hypothetical protein IPK02_18200 [Candidatus Accumulibacter sp.]|uniref:Uncharacterized protein n=1 Tax=Candidatus Accumulibacter affinis TaxID=2954384 RepID=A0A935TCV4_9PROT|nr:hypothetical protein [Candidatus Accumulibacter affinis]
MKPDSCLAGGVVGEFGNQAICADKKDQNKAECNGVVLGYAASGKPLCLTEKPVDPDCQAAGGTVVGTINKQPVCSKMTDKTCASGTLIGVVNDQAVCDGATGCKAGEAPGTVNGVTSCWPIGKVTDKKTTQKAGTTGTDTTVTPPGGTPTTTNEKSSTTCDGDRCTTTKTTTDGSGTKTESKTEDKSDFCDRMPNSPLCKETEAGTPASDAGLYTKKAETVAEVLGNFRATVTGSAFYTAASGFFGGSIPSGSCTGLNVNVSVMGHTWALDAEPVLCGSTATSIYTILGLGVMLAASWVGFRIAIL